MIDSKPPTADPTADSTTVYTACPHDCPDRCAVVATVGGDGKLLKVSGDPQHPQTDGFLCGKVTRYARRVYADTRLLYPLLRDGGKGTGRFRRASWTEAADVVATKLRDTAARHGPLSIAHYQGTGSLGILAENAFPALVRHLGGTGQVGSICGGESLRGWQAGAGTVGSSDPLRILASDVVVLWGCNAAVSNMHLFGLVKKARARGARLVVIDPYETLTARKADLYIKPFPGTDGALAMGLARLLRERGAWDRDFLSRHVDHVEAFEQLCGAQYDIAAVARLTRVAEPAIRQLADLLAGSGNVFLRVGIGMTRHAFGGHALWAIAALGAVRGVYAHPGGGVLGMTQPDPDYDPAPLYPTPYRPAARTCNVNSLATTLTTLAAPRVHALLVACGNPLATSPELGRVRQGMLREDLFTVVHEQFMTDTALLADVVLPASTFLESDDLLSSYGTNDYFRQVRAIEPRGEAVSSFECARRLAAALGLVDTLFDRSEAEAMRTVYEATSLPWSYAEWSDGRAHRPARVSEPTAAGFGANGFGGKFQLRRPDFAAQRWPELPGHYEGSWGVSQLAADQFHLMSPPTMEILNSSFAVLGDGQRSGPGAHELVLVAPEDAARLGLSDGVEVELANEHGAIRRQVRISAALQPQLLVVEGVYWESQLNGRGGVNRLTSGRTAALSGIPTYHEVVVRLSRTT